MLDFKLMLEQCILISDYKDREGFTAYNYDTVTSELVDDVLKYIDDRTIKQHTKKDLELLIHYLQSEDNNIVFNDLDIDYNDFSSEAVDSYINYNNNLSILIDYLVDKINYNIEDIYYKVLLKAVKKEVGYGVAFIEDQGYIIERGEAVEEVLYYDGALSALVEYVILVNINELIQYIGYYGLWSVRLIDGSYYLTTSDFEPLDYEEDFKDIHFIDVTKWRDSNGNTYHTTMIYYEDQTKEHIPYTYGYGRQWQTTIKEYLNRDIDYSTINYKDRIVDRKKDMV